MPHIDVGNNICYFSPGVVVLDIYDPATAIAQCLDQATFVLDQICLDPDYRANDIQDEFLAHWEFGQLSLPWPVLIGSVKTEKHASNYFVLQNENIKKAIIADSAIEVEQLCSVWNVSKKNIRKCWIFQTQNAPIAPDLKFPETIKELFKWLQAWDRTLYKEIQDLLGRDPEYLKYKFAVIAIHTPIGWMGFGIHLDHMIRMGYQRAPERYRQYLHAKGGNATILRLSITDVSPSFVHSRNLAFQDLAGRNITVVGCGAVGGYVAQSLVRLGAGTENGTLTLIDPEYLGTENLGRHYLGYPALFQPKAEALKDELLRQFPLSKIVAKNTAVVATPSFFVTDLIINATGEEAIGEMLNNRRLGFRPIVAPLLHVWIKGNGEAVQSLWTDETKYGCFRCLRFSDTKRYREDRFRLLKTEPARKQLGCHAFTPYAVSAPLHAASLAIDAVIDWMKGDPSPRFRTRQIENADINQVKNQDITRLNGCPACAQS